MARQRRPAMMPCVVTSILPIAAFVLGGLFCALNFYLSALRYPVHRLLGRPRETYHWVSGAPLVGSLMVAVSLVWLHHHPFVLAGGLFLILIDTGGIHWFFAVMLWYYVIKRPKGPNAQTRR